EATAPNAAAKFAGRCPFGRFPLPSCGGRRPLKPPGRAPLPDRPRAVQPLFATPITVTLVAAISPCFPFVPKAETQTPAASAFASTALVWEMLVVFVRMT